MATTGYSAVYFADAGSVGLDEQCDPSLNGAILESDIRKMNLKL